MISQPMNGKTKEQIRKERAELVEKLESLGYEVIDTIIEETYDTPIEYLAKSIFYMAEADCILFMQGWETARGCKIEHEVAVNYGKMVVYEYGFFPDDLASN